jgi:xanthine dehydrogenase accessory factor
MAPHLSSSHQPARSLLADEDVLGDLIAWRAEGLRTALVTLVTIDGNTPRPLGAQMAVAEDQRFSGYLSGGCIEQAIALEACQVIATGQNRLVRYGKGSAYLDVQLPCGSGLDLYFDQGLTADALERIAQRRASRLPFTLVTDLVRGESRIEETVHETGCVLSGDVFRRPHLPAVRVLLAGGGPALVAIAVLLRFAGLDLHIITPDDAVRAELSARGIDAYGLADVGAIKDHFGDRWTAAVVAFHEHAWEAPVLARILRRPYFYVGVMGSRKAHETRLAQLREMGVRDEDIARLKSPIGMIGGAKSRVTLAAGVLADILAAAKAAGLVA